MVSIREQTLFPNTKYQYNVESKLFFKKIDVVSFPENSLIINVVDKTELESKINERLSFLDHLIGVANRKEIKGFRK